MTTAGQYVRTLTGNAMYLQWEEWLAELEYKPGWEFSLASGDPIHGVEVSVGARVLDSTTREPTFIVHQLLLVDAAGTMKREAFHRAVLRCVVQIETHEAMEFLRASGERVRDPHARGQVLYEI